MSRAGQEFLVLLEKKEHKVLKVFKVSLAKKVNKKE